MALVTRGKTYDATETVTNTNLHQLVDSATVTAIVSADFTLSATNPVHIGATEPSNTDQRPWYDTPNDVFRVKDNAGAYQPVSQGRLYTNKSGGSLAAGDIVIIDTSNDNSVTTTTTEGDPNFFGVCLIGGADNATVAITTDGYCPVITVDGSTDNGDYLQTSTTVKKATSSSAFAQGSFARAITTSSSAVSGVLSGFATQITTGKGTVVLCGRVNAAGTTPALTSSIVGATFTVAHTNSTGVYDITISGLDSGKNYLISLVINDHGDGTWHAPCVADKSGTTGWGTYSGFNTRLTRQVGGSAGVFDSDFSFAVVEL